MYDMTLFVKGYYISTDWPLYITDSIETSFLTYPKSRAVPSSVHIWWVCMYLCNMYVWTGYISVASQHVYKVSPGVCATATVTHYYIHSLVLFPPTPIAIVAPFSLWKIVEIKWNFRILLFKSKRNLTNY